MSHAENAEYAEAFQTRSAWGADRWVYNRAGTVPRGEDFGVELFRAVIFVLSGVRKFDWVVGNEIFHQFSWGLENLHRELGLF